MSNQRTYRGPNSQAGAFAASEDFLPALKNAKNGRKVGLSRQFGEDEMRPSDFSQSPPDKEVVCELAQEKQPCLPPNSPDFSTSRGAALSGKSGDGRIDRIARGRPANGEFRHVRPATSNRLIATRTGAADSALRSHASRSYGAESAPTGRRATDSKTDSAGRLRRRSRDPIQTGTRVLKETRMGWDTEYTDNTDRQWAHRVLANHIPCRPCFPCPARAPGVRNERLPAQTFRVGMGHDCGLWNICPPRRIMIVDNRAHTGRPWKAVASPQSAQGCPRPAESRRDDP